MKTSTDIIKEQLELLIDKINTIQDNDLSFCKYKVYSIVNDLDHINYYVDDIIYSIKK